MEIAERVGEPGTIAEGERRGGDMVSAPDEQPADYIFGRTS
jgi:hypothetical protein